MHVYNGQIQQHMPH